MNDFSFAASLSRQHTGTVVEDKQQQEPGGGCTASATASSSFSYTLRGLRDEREIRQWATFCASCFSYKANPPPAEYFERHYYNDPNRGHVSLIRVAVVVNNDSGDHDDEIVASCRIFPRDIANGSAGGILRAGGIGEVCTSSHHRRRGLSKELLQDCLEIMSNNKNCMNLTVSFLHAAPAFFPVYASAGYVGTTSRWSTVQILHPQLLSSSAATAATAVVDGYHVRLANFPDDTNQLETLHRSLVSHHGFAGCIIRSTEYWNEYLSQELKESLWVLEEEDCSDKDTDPPAADANDEKKVTKWNIVAWLAIRPRAAGGDETKWQLRDFGYCLDHQRADSGFVSQALAQLLQHAISSSTRRESGQSSESSSLELHLPTFVLEQLKNDTADSNVQKDDPKKCSFIDWHNVVTENDGGWMYRPLLSCIKENNDETLVAEQETASSSSQQQLQLPPETWKRHNIPHLIWPADSF